MGLLDGKRILVTGVLTDASIGFHIARLAQLEGATLVLTGFGRITLVERIARRLPEAAPVIELDVTSGEQLDGLAAKVSEHLDGLDGVVHSIGFAPQSAMGGNFMSTAWDDVATALQVSAYSLKSLTVACLPLMKGEASSPGALKGEASSPGALKGEAPSPGALKGEASSPGAPKGGGSVVGLDFDSALAWPAYDWMGVAKAGLESTARYLARYLGPDGVRVNLVAAGPLKTMAAKSIPGFDEFAGVWPQRAPLGWNDADPEPAARACVALLSDWFPATTGEIVHVDGGVHAVGG